ncbi:hypothetical protein NVP2275O_338 [Vibrio phage 2.275.O._10N.286.54.E11]|nr:hypothetical protein NVP2275O_338 [Vibrio phage 2.275.O._10N.286.54.E11]
MFTGVAQGLRYTYFFDTKERENLELYFALKGKNDLTLNETAKTALIQSLASDIGKFDFVYFPESSNPFIKEIASLCGAPVEIPKNSKDFIKQHIFDMFLMRDEKKAFNEAFDEMGDSFQMHLMKSNQRWRTEKILFQDVAQHEGRIALLDDSVFSGYTLKAAYDKVPEFVEKICIFSK